tara:strand:- start:32933 stop:33985 length:1053 start_codon:yes stop_codon:yes gene_type:complete
MIENFLNINLNNENNLIIKILFNEKDLIKSDFININYEKFVKIASSHLILPTLYVKLKINKCLRYIPLELKRYLREIFIINKSRNEKLIKEISEISQFFTKNNIEHIFLKGSAHIVNGLYDDNGERMIGDIDILIKTKDEAIVRKIISQNKYLPLNNEFNYFKLRHIPRHIKKNKIFAIEIHTKLFDTDEINIFENIFEKKIKNKNICIPSNEHQNLFNIYNYQINDFGHIKKSYSYRSIYDSFLLVNKKSCKIPKLNLDKFMSSYLSIVNILKINFDDNEYILSEKFSKLIFKIKNSSKILNFLYLKIVATILSYSFRKNQIKLIFLDSSYRAYLKRRFKIYFSDFVKR